MMQYRRNRSTKSKSTGRIILSVLGVLFVATVDWLIGSPIQSTVRSVTTPLMSSVHAVTTERLAAYLVSKESLKKENEALRQEIATLEQNARVLNILEEDSERFCAVSAPLEVASSESVIPPVQKKKGAPLGFDIRKQSIAQGRVIAYERVLFGTLIVQFTTEGRPSVGDYVLDDAGNPLGVVEEVFEHDAKVSLLTTAPQTHEVRIHKTTAIAHGRMSNTFALLVPQETEVAVGDTVVLTHLQLPLGSVVSFERSPADAQVIVYVRPYSRPLATRFVSFIKAPPIEAVHE